MEKALPSLLLILAMAAPARAAFQAAPVNARAQGLGRATAALEEGAAALFVNPAGPAGARGGQISADYGRLFMGLPGVPSLGLGSFAASLPVWKYTLAFGVGQFSAGGLKEELTAAAGVSRAFGALRLGVAAKRLSHRYLIGGDPLAAADPVFANGTGRGGWTADAGAQWRASEALTLGAAVRNALEPDLGLASEDRVPRELQAGAAWRAHPRAALTADLIHRHSTGELKEDLLPAAGLELYPYKDRLALRLGGNPREFTAGFGVGVGRWRLDYGVSFKLGLLADNAGSHRLGMTYLWGGGK